MSLDEFFSAYDRVLLKWPADTQAIDVKTVHGTTRLNACGPADGPALVLLPGGGCAVHRVVRQRPGALAAISG
ncbi:MAG: hypothetical protein WBG53_03660, partial [Rhodococcus sp. (in: high G+C Gram-positive bacteria)]